MSSVVFQLFVLGFLGGQKMRVYINDVIVTLAYTNSEEERREGGETK